MPSLPTSRYVNIEDLRRGAKRRLPRAVFDYIDGGADGEITLRENCRAYEDITLPAALRGGGHAGPDLRTTVLGTPIALPLILAPVGSSRMFWPRGEEVAAAVAGVGRHDLFALDAVGLPAGGREEVDARAGVVSALSRAAGARSRARRSSARRTSATPR